MARTSRSSASRNATASASVGALAVRRTLIPSIPLARNAMVSGGAPGRSSASRRDEIRSASVDSAIPHVRSTRLRIVAMVPVRATRSGRIARSSMSFISYGTPGTA